MPYYIRKTSGEKEEFNIKKFRRSLHKAGVEDVFINTIVDEVQRRRPKSTQKIHEMTLDLLEKIKPPLAARYNLKRALMELGPAGYPFEKFVSKLFEQQGFNVLVGQICAGICVDHEVDIIARKEKKHFMIECKFHNRPGLKTTVKVTLYIHARFLDIKEKWEKDPNHSLELHQAWLVSNTQFTTEAIKYAACRNIKLLGWAFPKENGLEQSIERLGLHPITALTTLSRRQKRAFIADGLVLCREIQEHRE
ncbi:MAG: restriction endonuclease, partial [bacterium]|nr:restriction endonuclease [bacterium]